ncbi:GNAT family N-acetyltransferase [Chthonobacter albigriseus]|uniref:GNAT family N-acetyltransferase n=1 Tax=Chthonobacter albigriseus TaxID=1683161 RepID=UPI0015EFA0E1|nr:GNAT family N-acetyltransferase [Chthonobacter albigriseus]
MNAPLADGYHPLLPGKLATLVTYVEMTSPPQRPEAAAPAGYDLAVVESWTVADFKRLYVEIGFEWLWTSRLLLSDDQLLERLHKPGTVTFTPLKDERRMGVLEMDYADPENPEVSFFGLVPEAIGGGVGKWLMDQAIRMAWSRPETKRLWLHTCHFDSPQALPFYLRMGFKPYARAVEVFDDARLLNKLDVGAGPHVPVIRDARLP